MKHIKLYEEFVNESHLWNPSMNKLVFGRGGNGTSQEYLEDSWKRRNFDIPASFFEEAHKEKNKSKQEELIKKIGLINDAHNTEKEALRTGEYFLEMWRKKNNLEYDKKTVFESLLGESTVNESVDVDKLIKHLESTLDWNQGSAREVSSREASYGFSRGPKDERNVFIEYSGMKGQSIIKDIKDAVKDFGANPLQVAKENGDNEHYYYIEIKR